MQESSGMKTLDLLFFDGDGEHRGAANELCEVARPWA
jgi:hypothetical protein